MAEYHLEEFKVKIVVNLINFQNFLKKSIVLLKKAHANTDVFNSRCYLTENILHRITLLTKFFKT